MTAISAGCATDQSQQEVDPQEFIQNLKVELAEGSTFTPKGQVKAFPRAPHPSISPLDSPDVGHRCVGARINGKMVPCGRLRTATLSDHHPAGHKPSRDGELVSVACALRIKP
jgi:hypothetical protein